MTNDKLRAMLVLQNALNKKIHPEWHRQNFPWHRAVMVEGAEALEHFGWKWWKNQQPDREQVRIELADIWHFVLSLALQNANGSIELAAEAMHQAFMTSPMSMGGMTTAEKFDALIGSAAAGHRVNAPAFKGLMIDLEMDWEALYTMYVAKNVLNMFRQDNGYKDGSYVKLWWGQEDNVHLAAHMERDPSATPEQLRQRLEIDYAKVKAGR